VIRLVIEYWNSSDEERNIEVKNTINKNIKSGYFDHIIIFTQSYEGTSDIIKQEIVDLHIGFPKRYCDMIDYINEITSENDINIISNSDILFDETIVNSNKVERGEVYCLSRWENGTPYGEMIIATDNQTKYKTTADTWVWLGKLNYISAYDFRNNLFFFGDYCLGEIGCDNAFAFDLVISKYVVWNPFDKIKCHHIHDSKIRNGSSNNNNYQNLRIPNTRYMAGVPFVKGEKPQILHQPFSLHSGLTLKIDTGDYW